MTPTNIDSFNVFNQKLKIFELKKSLKRSLYDKRIAYGKLCEMNLVNQNLRLSPKYLLENIDKEKTHNSGMILFNIDEMLNLSLNESLEKKEIDNQDKFTDFNDLKINLNENFRTEIEKIFYDSKLELNPRPAKREIRLLKMLKEKIKRLNSLE